MIDDHEKKLCAFSFLAAEADGEVLGASGTAAAAAAVRTWKKFTEHQPRQWKMSMENVLVCNSGLLAFHADRRGRVLQKVFSTALHLPMLKMSQEVRNCCRFAHNRLQKCKQQSNTSKNFKQSQQIGQALLVPFSLFRAICSKLVFASNPQRR